MKWWLRCEYEMMFEYEWWLKCEKEMKFEMCIDKPYVKLGSRTCEMRKVMWCMHWWKCVKKHEMRFKNDVWDLMIWKWNDYKVKDDWVASPLAIWCERSLGCVSFGIMN
jgi:hypothetical protein